MCKAGTGKTVSMEDHDKSESLDGNQVCSALPPPKSLWQAMVDDIVDTRQLIAKELKPDKRRKSFLIMLLMDRSHQQTPQEEEEVGKSTRTDSQEEKGEEHASSKNFWQNTLEDVTQARTAIAKSKTRRKSFVDTFLDQWQEKKDDKNVHDQKDDQNEECTALVNADDEDQKKRNLLEEILHDFTEGDQKILRALGRTALVNLVVALSAFTGGALTSVAGFATGGAITANRLGHGVRQENPKEVAKSLAVYGCATTASITGQAVAGALMITMAGATIPVAAAVAFGVGCTSGVVVGALSEWGVECAWQEWGVWLQKQSADGSKSLQASNAHELVWVDVPLKMLCGPQDELVKQRLGLPSLKFHRSESEDTTDTTESESSESDTDLDAEFNADRELKVEKWGNQSEECTIR